MKDIGCAALAVSAIAAGCIYITGCRIENLTVHPDSDRHRSNYFAVIRAHCQQHARGGGTFAAATDIESTIRLIHRHGNGRITRWRGPLILDGEFHCVVLDYLPLILVVLKYAPLAVRCG